MINLQINGSVLLEKVLSPLPDLVISIFYKQRILSEVSSATTQQNGSFSFHLGQSKEFEIYDVLQNLSFSISDHKNTDVLYEVSLTELLKKNKLHQLDIVIPQEVFYKVRKNQFVQIFGDDTLLKEEIEVGASLSIEGSGFIPALNYELEIHSDKGIILSNSIRTNNKGEIESTMIWHQLGINSLEKDELLHPNEANEKWEGALLSVIIKQKDEYIFKKDLKVIRKTTPMVYASLKDGRPVNAIQADTNALYVSIANTSFYSNARIYLVERQHDWKIGDEFKIASTKRGRPISIDIELSKEKRSHTFLIDKIGQLIPGAYDIIIRPLRYGFEDNEFTQFLRRDLISSRRLTGIVIRENFWNAKPVLGGCVNKLPISGRDVIGAPYFQYSDTFTLGENVYGGLDPGIVDPANISKQCALYVIQSKDDPTWNVDNSLNHLAVLGGNANVQKVSVQPGCMNVNKHLLWSNANIPGEYDIIADFGNNTSDPMSFVNDHQYNTPLDIIDGYFIPGFRVVEDPGTMTQWAHAGTWHYDESIVNLMGLNGSPSITDENTSYFAPGGFIPTSRTIRLQARVFYPTDTPGVTDPAQISSVAANYPLIVIVHGNGHDFTNYNFLLEHFAKNGFIAVSIDCKFLSGGSLTHGMHGLGRAEALFKHLEVIFTKFGTTVQNNIGVMGHSRGGEAVLKAARLNQSGALGYNLNAIMSLAPTDQYGSEILGGAHSAPYFVLYGSRDGDITGGIWTSGYTVPQTGFALWDRANGSEKSMAFVYLATHNGFITTNYDSSDVGLLPASTQQVITKAYMNAFFRMHLKNDTNWKGMFTGEWKPASVSSTMAQLFTQYQDSNFLTIDNFEGTPNWQLSSVGDTVTSIGLPVNPVEGKLRTIDNRSPHDSQGLKVLWDNNTDTLNFSIPAAQKDVSGYSHLSFRITQKDGSASNLINMDQNLRVSLKDGSNNERAVRVSSFYRIPYPDQRPSASHRKSAMVTIRIPLKSYTIVCAGQVQVNLTDITNLGLKFSENNTGEILIDNIEFSN